MTFTAQILWAVSGFFYKISLLLLFIQLIPAVALHRIAQVTIAVVVLFEAATIIVTFLICHPLESNWNTSIPSHCGDKIMSYRTTGSLNIVTDFVILMLPLPYLAKLQMGTTRKIGIMATFALGLL